MKGGLQIGGEKEDGEAQPLLSFSSLSYLPLISLSSSLSGRLFGGAAGEEAGDGGFFGDDEVEGQGYDEEGEYVEYSSSDVFNRPGPFDDLFEGDGDQLVQFGGRDVYEGGEVEPRRASKGRAGGGGRGKRSGRGQKKAAGAY